MPIDEDDTYCHSFILVTGIAVNRYLASSYGTAWNRYFTYSEKDNKRLFLLCLSWLYYHNDGIGFV
ncbi:MAG: hypothetical protein ACK5C0_06020 [Candidatus Kapaibacterium sp.]